MSIQAGFIKSGFTIVWRQAYLFGLSIVSRIFLSKILYPEDFGIFSAFLFVFNFLTLISLMGINVSAIRHPEKPSFKELQSLNSFVMYIFILISLIMIYNSNLFFDYFKITNENSFVFLIILIASFGFISFNLTRVKFERNLSFKEISIAEVIESTAFQLSAILFAWHGYGYKSLVIAMMVKSIISFIYLFLKAPISFQLVPRINIVKQHLTFGVPFFIFQLLNVTKDSIIPLFMIRTVGKDITGIMNWAGNLASYPAIIVTALARLYLSAFSRLQNDKAKLSILFNTVLRWNNLFLAPITMIILFWGDFIILFVFGERWLGATNLFKLYSVSNYFIASYIPSLALLNALGFSKKTMIISLIWALGTWFLGTTLTTEYGAIGFGYAHFIINCTNILTFYWVKKVIPEASFFTEPFKWWGFAIFLGAIVGMPNMLFNLSPIFSILSIATFGILYSLSCFFLFGSQIKKDLQIIVTNIRR